MLVIICLWAMLCWPELRDGFWQELEHGISEDRKSRKEFINNAPNIKERCYQHGVNILAFAYESLADEGHSVSVFNINARVDYFDVCVCVCVWMCVYVCARARASMHAYERVYMCLYVCLVFVFVCLSHRIFPFALNIYMLSLDKSLVLSTLTLSDKKTHIFTWLAGN